MSDKTPLCPRTYPGFERLSECTIIVMSPGTDIMEDEVVTLDELYEAFKEKLEADGFVINRRDR